MARSFFCGQMFFTQDIPQASEGQVIQVGPSEVVPRCYWCEQVKGSK